MVKFILDNFDTIFRDEKSFETFDKMILDLAVRGKLVPQIEDEEPASKLLEKIKEEKEKLIAEKVIKKEKPLPLITEDEKPFHIPDSWEWVRLGEISTLRGGKRVSNGYKLLTDPTPYIYIRVTDMKNYSINDFGLRYIDKEMHEKIKYYIIKKEDLYITIAGTIGYVGEVPEKFDNMNLTENAARITPYLMNKKYLRFILNEKTVQNQFKEMVNQMAQPKLALTRALTSIFPVPPLQEQERIVEKVEKLQELSKKFKEIYNSNEKTRANLKKSILEEVEKSDTNNELLISLEKLFGNFEKVIKTKEDVKDIRNLVLSLAVRGKLVPQIEDEEPASKLLEKIKEEKERLIAEKVIKKEKPLPPITEDEKPYDIPNSWEWVYFSDVLDVRDGTHDTPKYEASGIPLVTSKNIYNGTLNFENLKYISYEDHLKISSRSKVELNDILFAMIGSIGNPVIVDTNKEFSIKNVALFKYYIKNSIDKKYLWYYLKHVQDNMILNASGGVQKFVSLGYLRKYIFSLPPLEEQERIVKRVDELMAVCDTLESKIEIGEKINQKLLTSLLK
ncbi:restriction endonuclease subunit S [Cetobacterium sp.]